jgi:hypothetical protein
MGNTLMEMRTEHTLRRYAIPKESRVWSIPAVDFVYELQSIERCNDYFDWPLHVWPTIDGKKFIIPVAEFSIVVITGMTCSLVHAKRFDLLEKTRFTVVNRVNEWKSISPINLENDKRPSSIMTITIFYMMQSLIKYNVLIEYLERYSTPYLKWFVKNHWKYFLDKTEDKLEIRMYLIRYIQDAPQRTESEEELVGGSAWKLWRR